jgi:hypothetical protein
VKLNRIDSGMMPLIGSQVVALAKLDNFPNNRHVAAMCVV